MMFFGFWLGEGWLLVGLIWFGSLVGHWFETKVFGLFQLVLILGPRFAC